jgi:DNA-directed RNA polymerase subunit H (RpoH/RPB5)
MSDIEKIAKSRKILKELLEKEWNTEDLPILSEEEIRHLYNTNEIKNIIYNNFGKGTVCNFTLEHKILKDIKLHIIYYNFPDFNKKKIKITKSIENKINILYDDDLIGKLDNLFIIINENISDSIIQIKNNINNKLQSDIDISSVDDEIKKHNLNLTKKHFKYVDIYNLNSLQININKHELVPEHRILRNNDEIEKILKKCNATKKQLPIINKQDPIAKINMMIEGDICEIKRVNRKGENLYYRICR